MACNHIACNCYRRLRGAFRSIKCLHVSYVAAGVQVLNCLAAGVVVIASHYVLQNLNAYKSWVEHCKNIFSAGATVDLIRPAFTLVTQDEHGGLRGLLSFGAPFEFGRDLLYYAYLMLLPWATFLLGIVSVIYHFRSKEITPIPVWFLTMLFLMFWCIESFFFSGLFSVDMTSVNMSWDLCWVSADRAQEIASERRDRMGWLDARKGAIVGGTIISGVYFLVQAWVVTLVERESSEEAAARGRRRDSLDPGPSIALQHVPPAPMTAVSTKAPAGVAHVVVGSSNAYAADFDDASTLLQAVKTPLPPDMRDLETQECGDFGVEETDIGTMGWAEEAERRHDDSKSSSVSDHMGQATEDPFSDPSPQVFVVEDDEDISPRCPKRV